MTPDDIDITLVTNPWQALVLVVLILAFVVWPGIAAWIQARRSASAVHEVKTTLQENNGGGSVRDALDRIEAAQASQGVLLEDLTGRVTTLERATQPRPRRLPWRR